MMNKKCLAQFLCLVIVVCTATGCEQYAKFFKRRKQKKANIESSIKSRLPQKIESIDLAKMILKDEPVVLSVKRDPFKPLLRQGTLAKKEKVSMDQETLRTAKILGITKMGDEFSVLMSLGDKKGVFSLHEKIGGFELTEITTDFIVLKKGEKTYTIKRGGNE